MKTVKRSFKKTDFKFTVEVNYAKTVEEMVKEGQYDRVNPNITQYNFPHNLRLKPKKIIIELIRLKLARPYFHNNAITAEPIRILINELYKKDFRPANLPELLTLHCEKISKIPVIGFETSHCGPDGNPYGVYFFTEKIYTLGLTWGTLGFPGEFLIAAIGKKPNEKSIMVLPELTDCEDLGDDLD